MFVITRGNKLFPAVPVGSETKLTLLGVSATYCSWPLIEFIRGSMEQLIYQ